MEDRVIHPSMKSVFAAFLLSLFVILAAMWGLDKYAQDQPRWLYFVPFITWLVPLNMLLKRRMITLRFHDDHLTLETGFFSRTRRTVDMAKIQDVTVHQTLGQRVLGTGDLMLEDAGESGAITVLNLDRPREIADAIIQSSRKPNRSV